MINENLRSVCAWCNREMHHDKLSKTTSMGNVVSKELQAGMSHGICKDCMENMMKQHRPQHAIAAAHESFKIWLGQRQKSKGE